eukprot:547925_1
MGAIATALSSMSDDRNVDPYIVILLHWIRTLGLEHVHDLNEIIIQYSHYIGLFSHTKRKQILAIRKWKSKYIEYAETRKQTIEELQSSAKSWKCKGTIYSCNAYNDTCKTLVTNHKEGVVIQSTNRFDHFESDVVEKKLVVVEKKKKKKK